MVPEKIEGSSSCHITTIKFSNFKAFKNYSVSLDDVNILVGPNNCGKSTIIGAIRALSGAMRIARTKKAQWLTLGDREVLGYNISSDLIGISIENAHTNYVDQDAQIIFRCSNQNALLLRFPRDGGAVLLTESKTRCETPAQFKKLFPLNIVVVPVLSRLEHQESFVDRETVTRNFDSHRASRHFRNYWHYFPEKFDHFAQMVANTWPGMSLQRQELIIDAAELKMFCKENRIDREIFWAGSGFQIWCQILTHICRVPSNSILAIDEPEIYLHPNLQRKLIYLLRDLNSDVVVATHSTEIMAEADPSEMLVIDKSKASAVRLKQVDSKQDVFDKIGSIQNITLSQLSRTRRVLFVESLSDFKILQKFAKVAGFTTLSEESRITPVESGGSTSLERIKALKWGIERTLGKNLLIGAVFDRDYKSQEEVDNFNRGISPSLDLLYFLERKEIENYLLDPEVLGRAIKRSLADQSRRTGKVPRFDGDTKTLILKHSEEFRLDCQVQYVAKRIEYLKSSGVDSATITVETIKRFELKWANFDERLLICPGKKVLKSIRDEVQQNYGISLTTSKIISEFTQSHLPTELLNLFERIAAFENEKVE